jgi:nucleotide-binding universal stress UspA family protein
MTNKGRTGSVTSKKGKVTARRIVTGIDIEGAASDEVLQTALEAMDHLQTGGVSGAEGVEVSEEIVTGFRHLNPQAPDRQQFLAELQQLRQDLAAVAREPDVPREAAAAVEALDGALVEAKKEQPLVKVIVNRLRDTVEFISDAGKALDAAHKAGPLILKAIPVAMGLYQVAQALF